MSSGLVLIDKPSGWTSHDVVAKLRKIAGTKKVGHAGTLDPMATGLLLLGVNSATKLLTFLIGADKTYVATIRLGASTITDDKESEFVELASPQKIALVNDDEISAAIKGLTGEIMQVPSSVSAIKVDGQRAYAKVRGGDEVKLAARAVTISKFEIVGAIRHEDNFIDLDVEIDCSSGTYIRALARDLGSALGIGGHLTALRRTRIGIYSVDQAQQLKGLEKATVLPIAEAARSQFATIELTDQQVIDIRHGKRLAIQAKSDSPIAAFDSAGQLVAMLTEAGGQLRSLVVFA